MKTKKYHTPRKELMAEELIRTPDIVYHPKSDLILMKGGIVKNEKIQS